jgi:general secretion pathway protein A
MEYYQYFRLKGPPFQPASPKSAVYFSPTHLEALTTLESGLTGELTGLTLLTGEAGTGKTTLIYALLQRDYKRVRIANIDDPKLSFMEMMQVVLPQLNLYTAGSTKLDYLRTLDHLLDLHGTDERIAIIVDEAQVASDEVLDELRLLSNRGQRNDRCLLQLILVGQPELAERLKKPELRQLNQRISSRGCLEPLKPRQATMYVECLLSAQGGKCAEIFEKGALDRLLRLSDGIPRKINMLCHSAMLGAFYGGERKVSLRTAKKVAAEYQASVAITKPASRWKGYPIAGAALAAVLLLGLVKPYWWSGWLSDRPLPFGGRVEAKIQPANRHAGHQRLSGTPRETKVAAPPATHFVEARAPAASAPAARPAPKSSIAEKAAAAETAKLKAAPVLATETQKPSAIPPAPERRPQMIVRYGDTLEKIAIRYFGSDSGINQLIEANPQLTDINQLTVGQVIYLPPGNNPKLSRDQTASEAPVQASEESLDPN